MSMENEHFGIVVWRYTDVAYGRESFGFKRIMVSKEPGLVKLLLVGEHPFGLEVFERVVTAGAPRAEESATAKRPDQRQWSGRHVTIALVVGILAGLVVASAILDLP